VETTHDTHHGHEHDHEDEHRHFQDGDWNNEEYARSWLARQEENAPARRQRFTVLRALLPKNREDEFSYINLGAGPGILDEVLLEQFPGAQATVVDVSLVLLSEARKRLARFGDRVEYVQANLGTSDWVGAVGGPFDFALSTMTMHHVGGPERIRALYAETYRLLGHGGMFLNMDFVRPSRPSLSELGAWAAKDPDAGLSGRSPHGAELPGTLQEHLGWLSEAGFPGVEVIWKNIDTAVMCGIRDHLHMPEGHEAHAHEGGHSHSEGGHSHSH
jgi:tRNA (cmo5U34)-methyltransferase